MRGGNNSRRESAYSLDQFPGIIIILRVSKHSAVNGRNRRFESSILLPNSMIEFDFQSSSANVALREYYMLSLEQQFSRKRLLRCAFKICKLVGD